MQKVSAGILPEALERVKDSEIKEFIMKCISLRKEDRPTARELLNSSFL